MAECGGGGGEACCAYIDPQENKPPSPLRKSRTEEDEKPPYRHAGDDSVELPIFFLNVLSTHGIPYCIGESGRYYGAIVEDRSTVWVPPGTKDRAYSVLKAHGARVDKHLNVSYQHGRKKWGNFWRFGLCEMDYVGSENIVHSARGFPFPDLRCFIQFCLRYGKIWKLHQVVYAMNVSEAWGYENLDLTGTAISSPDWSTVEKESIWTEACRVNYVRAWKQRRVQQAPSWMKKSREIENGRDDAIAKEACQKVLAQAEAEKPRPPPQMCSSCSLARKELRQDSRRIARSGSGVQNEECCIVQ